MVMSRPPRLPLAVADARPKDDAGCEWDYDMAQCKNLHYCVYRYQFGDFSLGSSCRLIPNGTAHTDDECFWSYSNHQCEPEPCVHRFIVGDFTLTSSCRLPESDKGTYEECCGSLLSAKCLKPCPIKFPGRRTGSSFCRCAGLSLLQFRCKCCHCAGASSAAVPLQVLPLCWCEFCCSSGARVVIVPV